MPVRTRLLNLLRLPFLAILDFRDILSKDDHIHSQSLVILRFDFCIKTMAILNIVKNYLEFPFFLYQEHKINQKNNKDNKYICLISLPKLNLL